jgi:polyhydroxybutyrate depolymerase
MRTAFQGLHIHTEWPEAIVVYPQGLHTVSAIDPQGVRSGWQTNSGQNGNRDLKFFDAILAGLRQKYAVDDQRIYSTGFSNGAVFSYLLWAERGKILAAFGICAGRVPATAHLTVPRAVIVIGGKSDTILPFSYQEQGIEDARHEDGATGPGQECGPGCTLYPSASHTPVVTRIHPGGHVFPPWAASAIVEFFKEHKHP